jgi:hypothetical protein
LRILFVAPVESIHVARWISQLWDTGWQMDVYPSIEGGVTHPELKEVTVRQWIYRTPAADTRSPRRTGLGIPSSLAVFAAQRVRARLQPDYLAQDLARVIRRLKPDLVHSMDTQTGGYLTLAARKVIGASFPKWVVTNWGSDVYLFGRLAAHRSAVQEVLACADYAFCECRRDVELMKSNGFRGESLALVPAGGGFRLDEIAQLRSPTPPSARRLLLVKGYQGWAGRALVALRALERCAELLDGREVAVFSATSEVAIAAELFAQRTGVPVRMIPEFTAHREILALHAAARLYIGLSISDAISLSLLEAMAMGAFPVQSCTSCGDEWMKHGRTGLLVPPEDVDVVEEALRRALADDALVDHAAQENWQTVKERLDWRLVRDTVIAAYQRATAQ